MSGGPAPAGIMGGMDAGPIDAADARAFADWYGVVDASHRAERGDEPGWQPAELRAPAVLPESPERLVPFAAVDGGQTVGAGWLACPRHDNTHLAYGYLTAHPQHRRRKVGSALLAVAEQIAADEGCEVVGGWQDEGMGEVGRSPGRAFAAASGFTLVQTNVRRDLVVPVPEARLAALERACAPHAAGYRLHTFAGPWPDEWMAARVEFGRRMSTDTPRGESARRDEVWDPARVRATEALLEASDRDHLVALARHEASGEVVAFSEIAVPRGAPVRAHQHDTLVLGEHRGHRLGTLVKVANLRQMAARSPATRRVTTYNASDNAAMIAVNDALGCVVEAYGLTWEKTL